MNVSDDGYVLHTRPFQDNKTIVVVITSQCGLQRVVFQTSRNSRKQTGITSFLQPFQSLWLTWKGSHELKTGKAVEVCGERYQLSGKLLYCGLYLNELLVRLLLTEENSSRLFNLYQFTLTALQNDPLQVEVYLRQFEFTLLAELGYCVVFDCDANGGLINPTANYTFLPDQGFCVQEQSPDSCYLFAGKDLLVLSQMPWVNGHWNNQSYFSPHESHIEWTKQLKGVAKHITRMALAPHLGNKPLMSRALFFKQK
ncbi:DNA repair protein RecO [Spartinivicinus ruber]|uniref:DNA repair protein RecO n=1 Tax=Spartinivicinus ruber TaxID=2683272 RepID=UPI0013D8417D|nr:DNA repair protein RecO [Spartinivicinus ruber]